MSTAQQNFRAWARLLTAEELAQEVPWLAALHRSTLPVKACPKGPAAQEQPQAQAQPQQAQALTPVPPKPQREPPRPQQAQIRSKAFPPYILPAPKP